MEKKDKKIEVNKDFLNGLQMIIEGQQIMIKSLFKELEKYEKEKK